MRPCVRQAPRPTVAAVARPRRALLGWVASWSSWRAYDSKASLQRGLKGTDKWIARIEPTLPPRLRHPDSTQTKPSPDLAPSAILDVLTTAQDRNHDILLGLSRQGRWRAVVWLASHLIDTLWKGNPNGAWRLPHSPFGPVSSYNDLVETPVDLAVSDNGFGESGELDRCVLGGHPLSRGDMRHSIQGHNALGEIWQSLGYMIIDDAANNKGSVRPEILELIALLHSHDIMPDSIYEFSPEHSHLAGSQPPTLRLLSSEIMTSLSDAAWNARQASAVENAQSSGKNGYIDGPELASSNYRVRVAGIRHEIWLELVLWSCLHGGWARHGAEIVHKLVTLKDQTWSPLSWRETMVPMIKTGEESNIDWDRVGNHFSHSSRTHDGQPNTSRTISSEVLSAYADAIVNMQTIGLGRRGVRLSITLKQLNAIRKFLGRHDYGPEATSWDGVVQRLLETETISIEKAPAISESILALSAFHDDENMALSLKTRDEEWRPKSLYTADGSAMALGVSHRILAAYVERGEAAGAFRVFNELQSRTDYNKRLAIATFFQSLQNGSTPEASTVVDFQSPLASLRHAGMYPLLPPEVMAPFLDLVTDVGAIDFGSWLIASQDIDGPTIDPLAYKNPLMIPAVVRFLAASGQEELLTKMLQAMKAGKRQRAIPPDTLMAIMDSQFRLNSTKAAVETFDSLLRTHSLSNATTEALLAILTREIVRVPKEQAVAREKLRHCLRGQHKIPRHIKLNIAAILLHLGRDMKEFCRDTLPMHGDFRAYPQTKTFNTILQGLTEGRGSEAGLALLCHFSRVAQDCLEEESSPRSKKIATISRAHTKGNQRPDSIYTLSPDAFEIEVQGARWRAQSATFEALHIRGSLTVNATTVRIILAKRLQEIRAFDAGKTDDARNIKQDKTVAWARKMLKAMGMRAKDIEQEMLGQYEQAKS